VATRPRLIGRRILARGVVESTQIEVARLAAAGEPEGTVVTCEHQRTGRGRRGRAWLDEPGASLLVSILLRPPIAPAEAPRLSLLAAVAVADALDALGMRAGIRWPNDILCDRRKVCGIIAEAHAAVDRLEHVIVGIGINVNQCRFPDEIRDIAGSLALATGARHDRARVLEALLDAMDVRYAQFRDGGMPAILDDWRRRSVTLGRRVRGSDGREGEAMDVDVDGALVLRRADGALVRVAHGEVSFAPAP
jgi:BirA family biotin operon repressor/biotin-[acetyl-CoA-carboxylase] ligase